MNFYGFDTTILKNLIDFLNFVLICRFYVVSLVVWKFLYNDRFHWFFMEK